MPTVTRKRTVAADPESVYAVVSDPARLSEWWPRVTRTENIDGKAGAKRTRWTCVLEADSGRLLRLDYHCSGANRPERYEWEHELGGTPYQKHLSRQAVEARITGQAEGSEVALTTINTLRGVAKVAGFSMKKGQQDLLDEALDSLAGVFAEPDPE